MQKKQELYAGKAKTVYTTDHADVYILEFRNDTSAFDGEKISQLANKGKVNNLFNAHIMQVLEAAGVATHFVKVLGDQASVVKRLEMIPVECVVRNYAAGGLCRRLGMDEGQLLSPPVFEFFLKNDELHDPMICDSHIVTFGWASEDEIAQMKKLTQAVNNVLTPLFAEGGLQLVDFKLEFGRLGNQIVLGDEFTPDGCRIWDSKTLEKFDKDRFRRNLGDVVEHYQMAAERLGIAVE